SRGLPCGRQRAGSRSQSAMSRARASVWRCAQSSISRRCNCSPHPQRPGDRPCMPETLIRLPALFLGHGSPMNALQSNAWTRGWAALGAALPRPRAVLAISAHWYIEGTAVTAMDSPRTIHDFGGFPRELFAVRYPARGDAALAARVQRALAPLPVSADHDWG